MPGVGAVHVPGVPTVLRGRDRRPGDFPKTLRAQLIASNRECILGSLVSAARNMAEANLISRTNANERRILECRECHSWSYWGGQPLSHYRGCSTGTALALIQELVALDFNPSAEDPAAKEAAE